MTKNDERYVYKRTDGRWEARYVKGFDDNGKRLFGAVYAKTKEEVLKRRDEKLNVHSVEGKAIPTQLNLLILGAGTHGHDVKEIAENLRIFKKIRFLDDNLEGEEIIGKCSDAIDFRNEYPCAFIAIGDNKIRKKYAKLLKKMNFFMPNIISPTATISPSAELGEGIAILPQSVIGASKIGDYVIIAANGVVNSDVTLEDYVHIDCGAMVLKSKKVPEGIIVRSGTVFK